MSKEDSMLLTPWGDRVHFHARDNIQAVRIIRLVSENEQPFAYYLTLAVVDEAGLVLWSEELSSFARPDKPQVAVIERDFAVWESLQISVNQTEGGEAMVQSNREPVDFLIRLYYTTNPETPLNDAGT
ncbi:hypothetical protein [Larkinella punicea]|uniref:Uncharacterized protein n=1 Tax=Larkinella punicea TaxID=2315727 RepID=A0A368JH62_9BACT|nr:hypothetical protein [Larkinella punicea]RCR66997.1 hypothetical protein DUE52_23335 [Larkinella punicea]